VRLAFFTKFDFIHKIDTWRRVAFGPIFGLRMDRKSTYRTSGIQEWRVGSFGGVAMELCSSIRTVLLFVFAFSY
jgi:hypothetical protein